jgi:prevent-host-death family protein
MSTTTVGIRELKVRLSYYLQQVKAGATLVITEHNCPIGKIVPAHLAIDDRLQALVDAGLVAWSGAPLSEMAPVAKTQETPTICPRMRDTTGAACPSLIPEPLSGLPNPSLSIRTRRQSAVGKKAGQDPLPTAHCRHVTRIMDNNSFEGLLRFVPGRG